VQAPIAPVLCFDPVVLRNGNSKTCKVMRMLPERKELLNPFLGKLPGNGKLYKE
jgi:hypothetical protein